MFLSYRYHLAIKILKNTFYLYDDDDEESIELETYYVTLWFE